MADILHLLDIDAPPQKIYRALTEADGIRGWWTPDTIIEPEVGFIAHFDFGDRYHNRMRIESLKPGKYVEWLCLEGDREWLRTRICFDLEATKTGTILRFAHRDWAAPTDFFASCNLRWGLYMMSLKQFCETGKGQPFRPPGAAA